MLREGQQPLPEATGHDHGRQVGADLGHEVLAEEEVEEHPHVIDHGQMVDVVLEHDLERFRGGDHAVGDDRAHDGDRLAGSVERDLAQDGTPDVAVGQDPAQLPPGCAQDQRAGPRPVELRDGIRDRQLGWRDDAVEVLLLRGLHGQRGPTGAAALSAGAFSTRRTD